MALMTPMMISETTFSIIMFFMIVPVILAEISMSVRRLHDIDKSGLYMFLGLIPLIGGIWLFVLHLMPGQIGPNKYGHDPKFSEL